MSEAQTTGHEPHKHTGVLRRALHRLSVDTEELDNADLVRCSADVGAQQLSHCPDRQRVAVRGVLRTVTLRPRAGTPSLEAQLYDGTGTVDLIWLGRRRIGGIEPGRTIVASGLIATADGRCTMFNPVYELMPSHD